MSLTAAGSLIGSGDTGGSRNTLQRRGYRTLEAADVREAIEVYRRFAGEMSLVLLDQTIPCMNGEEVLRELKIITPSVIVLPPSGFNEVEAIRRFTGKGLGFLAKALYVRRTGRKRQDNYQSTIERSLNVVSPASPPRA